MEVKWKENRILQGTLLFMLCRGMLTNDSNDTKLLPDTECSIGSTEDNYGNKKTLTCLQVDHPSGQSIIIKVRMYKNNATNFEQMRQPRKLIQETNCSVELINVESNCTISINNQQFLDIHDAFATIYSIDEGQHAAFLEVNVANGSLVIGGLMSVRSSKISNSKFLPFALAKLPDIIQFKVNTKPQTVPTVRLSVDMSQECISTLLTDQQGLDWAIDKKPRPSFWVGEEDKRPPSPTDYYYDYDDFDYDEYPDEYSDHFQDVNMTNGSIYGTDMLNERFYEYMSVVAHQKNDKQFLNYNNMDASNSDTRPNLNDTEASNKTESDKDYCFKREDNETGEVKWHCNAGYRMPSEQKHMIMMALYAAFFINLDTVTITRKEIVPVSDFEVCVYTPYTRLYPEYVASLYAEYGLRQCCNLNMFQLEVYGGFSNAGMRQLQWDCRDPYRITKMIERFIIVLSAIMTAFCPMAVKFFPSPHEVKHGNFTQVMKRVNLTTKFLRR